MGLLPFPQALPASEANCRLSPSSSTAVEALGLSGVQVGHLGKPHGPAPHHHPHYKCLQWPRVPTLWALQCSDCRMTATVYAGGHPKSCCFNILG